MTRQTRYFLLGSTAVLVVGLVVGLVAYYGGLPMGALARSSVPSELQYVPSDASLVAYANVHDIMRSQLRQRLQRVSPHKEDGQADFERHTGISIERDIDHVVAFATSGEGPDENKGMLLAAGRFDPARLEALAREHGGEVEEYRGIRIVGRKGEPESGGDVSVAFLAPGTVAVGSTPSIKASIDRMGAGSVSDNQELMNLIRAVDSGDAWAVGRFDTLMRHATLPDEVTRQLPPIRWFSAAGRVNGGLRAELRAEARDEESGQYLREAVNGLVALGKLQSGSSPELQRLVQSLEVTGSGRSVAIRFALPLDFIDSLGLGE